MPKIVEKLMRVGEGRTLKKLHRIALQVGELEDDFVKLSDAELREETGWRPRYSDLRTGLADTVAWYREHEEWWQVDKTLAEERYARLGR